MNKFEELDLPIYDLYNELQKLIEQEKIVYKDDTDQICLNSIEGKEENYNFGRGSLHFDWDASYYDHKKEKMVVPLREDKVEEKDFTVLCTQFKDTPFEIVYNALKEKFTLGRVRLIRSRPKTCMSWHKDDHPRVHFPLKTQEGCIMIIQDEMMHLEQNKWYITDTTVHHTAINSSREDRIHLVATIIDK